ELGCALIVDEIAAVAEAATSDVRLADDVPPQGEIGTRRLERQFFDLEGAHADLGCRDRDAEVVFGFVDLGDVVSAGNVGNPCRNPATDGLNIEARVGDLR